MHDRLKGSEACNRFASSEVFIADKVDSTD